MAPAAAPRPAGHSHPGLFESLVPVWGPGREAFADLQDRDYLGAGLNAAFVVGDLFGLGEVADLARLGSKVGVHGWKYTRRRLGQEGFAKFGQDVHHAFFPQRQKFIPEAIRNHPLNLKPMPSREVHTRLDRNWKGKSPFGPASAWWHGTPGWAKALEAGRVGTVVDDSRPKRSSGR